MKIDLIHVSRKFSRNQTAFYAVENVNLSLQTNQFTVITGKSGSGKSTLLSLIAGISKPDEGKILYDNQDISLFNDREMSSYRFHAIGYIPQENTLLSSFTVRENLILPCNLNHQNITDEKLNDLLEETGIKELADSYPEQLSGGEARRAVIARALIGSPDFLIADEPTSSLDPETADDICELLKRTAENGVSVLMVTHRPENTSYADRVYTMSHGRLTGI